MKLAGMVLMAAMLMLGVPLAAQAEGQMAEAVAPVLEVASGAVESVVKAAPGLGEVVTLEEVGNMVCPVSGEKITIVKDVRPPQYIYMGRAYNLSNVECIKKFELEPEKYRKIADAEVGAAKAKKDMPTAKQPVAKPPVAATKAE